MDHALQHHIMSKDKLCRLCGRINVTKKEKKKSLKPQLCSIIGTDLFLCGIDIGHDESEKHSLFVCLKCRSLLNNSKKRQSSATINTLKSLFKATEGIWCIYDATLTIDECRLCSHHANLTGGTLRNQTDSKKPKAFDENTVEMDLSTPSCSSQDTNFVPTLASTPIKSNTTIDIATSPGFPITDESSLCLSTMLGSIPSNKKQMIDTASSPISNQNVILEKQKETALSIGTSPHDKSLETVSDLLNTSESVPLRKKHARVLTSLAKRQLYAGPGKRNDTLKLKTGGLPLTFRKVTVPRKRDKEVSKRTMRNRSRLIESVRSYVGSDQSSELKSLSKDRRQEVLKKAGIKNRIQITKERALYLKEVLGLSTRKNRLLNVNLKKLGCKVASEACQRELARDIVKDFVCVEKKVFVSEEGKDMFESHITRIKNIPEFVFQLLDQYKDADLLTWHETIPEDHIWIKIGGDHGKKSMKLTLEIVNTPNPNSQGNTIVLGLATVKDSYENLEVFFNSGLGNDIKRLSRSSWKGKQFILFVNGDYEFLARIYGLSAPSCIYFCIWCLVNKHAMQEDNNASEPRTLATLHSGYETFVCEQHGDRSDAQDYNNCIHRPLVDVDLLHVAPPYLHILLGLVLKHHVLLKKEAHALDLDISNQEDEFVTENGKRIKQYGGNWKEAVRLDNQIKELDTRMSFDDGEMFNTLERQNHTLFKNKSERDLSKLKKTKLHFKDAQGPIQSSFTAVLDTNRIKEQLFHGGSFTGNHCHRYMKDRIYEKLTEELISQTALHTTDNRITAKAYRARTQFNKFNTLYREIHELVSHTKPIDKTQTDRIQETIDNYMANYRNAYPKQLTPKHHILEHHCTPFIKKFGCGLNLLGEQGTEASHQSIGKLEQRSLAILSVKNKLRFVMNEHIINASPTLHLLKRK